MCIFFLFQIDMETVNTLDNHLFAGAEIKEVYNRITKTSTKDFLTFDKVIFHSIFIFPFFFLF